MTYILAVFRSRTESIRFSDALTAARVPAALVNTPREAMTGCGVSVRFDARYNREAMEIFRRFSSHSFAGFWLQTEQKGRATLVKL